MAVDCLVIGGGVIGLTTAWKLAQQGLSVRLCDQSTPGREASWAGAGILPPGYPAATTNQRPVFADEEARGSVDSFFIVSFFAKLTLSVKRERGRALDMTTIHN